MELVLIGSGNIATVLGKAFHQRGISIKQVYSRKIHHATQLAGQLNAEPIDDVQKIIKNADCYLMAVSDEAIGPIAASLNLGDHLLVHTAGAISKEILLQASSNVGVFWPMKMIRKNQDQLGSLQIVVDGSTPSNQAYLSNLARLIGAKVALADNSQREKLHLMAVVCSNFTNHLYHLAHDYCFRNNLDFSLLYSIIIQTATGIQGVNPTETQAGPAFRGDKGTMEKHLQLLNEDPTLLNFYRQFSKSIQMSNEVVKK
jgi:predicted short-subunit dehydrogenase-like oxidoreductase (DUF2520 family)